MLSSETPMILVDADGHVMEPSGVWVDRMDADKWGELVPRYVEEDFDGKDSWYVGGVRRAAGSAIFGCSAGFDAEELLARNWKYTEGHAAAWDPAARLGTLDDEGIDATVLYPSLALTFGPLDPVEAVRDPRFVLDLHRAYNDWIADYCAAAPDRLFAMAAVPLQDVGLAVGEMQRAVGERGLQGVFVRTAAYVDDLPFSHRVYDPFWSACQEMDIAIGLHPATYTDLPNAARKFNLIRRSADMAVANKVSDEVVGGTALSIAVGAPVDAILTLGRLLMGGVCERFPGLRFLVLESGGGWAATILERMDAEIRANPQEARWLTMLPSEYFRRQCWISFEPDDPTLPRLADLIGPDRILWASDFPHSDAIYPGAGEAIRSLVAPLPPEQQEMIAGANAVAAYRLPVRTQP
jgi:predicted TIM-barrel fold metal-dependent hydrolase